MYLKKLEILGFKSFANKTVIDFSKGITAIVGPNGCGKTNILDALRWVLGEQKVTMLRGSKMEEVIFNGTRDSKPLGMSEVTLTLVNNRGILPTEYTEVQITRRLFRSGDSEYLINKIPCRLRDITELFYGTGVGAHSYSVIQQDMIESVISDKAEERRFLFEEASGITKYKQRKKAALRKLEATENDFLRLQDIYSEVQTQVRSLKRQQKKAERYQLLAEELKNWEIYLSTSRIKQIELDKRQLKAEYDQKHDQLTGFDSNVDSLSSQLEAQRKDQIDLERDLSEIGNEIFEITEKAHGIETEITILHEKKTNAIQLIDRNEKEVEAIGIRRQMLIDQRDEHTTELENSRQEAIEAEESLRRLETIQKEADQNLLGARGSKEEHNQKMIELEGKLSSGRTEEDNLKNQQNELHETLSGITEQLTAAETGKAELLRSYQTAREKLDNLTGKKTRTENGNQTKKTRLEELLVESDELTEDVSSLTASIEAAQARRTLLEEMILHYEGYESGMKAAMDVKDRWSGIHGTVAEKFTPVAGMEIAVEAALGGMAKFLICDTRQTARDIIAYLKAEQKGRIGILVRYNDMLQAGIKRPQFDSENFVGWLDQFVTTDDSLRPLMETVLARTAVFKGDVSEEILERLPYGFQAVTPEGELISKNIVTGGNDDAMPLFRRQEKVDELGKVIEEYRSQLDQTKERKNRTIAEIAEVRAELSTLATELEQLTEQVSLAQTEFNDIDYQMRGLDTEISRLQKEQRIQKEKLEQLKNRQYSLGLNFDQLTSERDTLVSNIAVSEEMLGELEAKASRASEEVSSAHIKLVEARSKTGHTESKIKHVNELLEELHKTEITKSDEITTARDDIKHADSTAAEREIKLKELFDSRKQTTEKQAVLRTSQSELMNQVNEREKQLKTFRGSRDEINDELHKIDIRLNGFESEAQTIIDRITEEYDLDVKAIEADNPDETLSREDAAKRQHELKDKLKHFGAVNLLALEEYKAASEREAFLSVQLEDLSTAKNDLQATINKINQTARELFEETLAKVRVNFKKLFTELFTGGEADIYLKDASDPLESDIEIYARPKGKKLVSITMMSGGERALTAISLLFSLYMVKPSPFCILDEIDAPLDDANCRRFLKIIDTFSNQTQFIMITHNKITMEASHNLYGVTMEQLGISKLVAVKFNEVREDGSFDLDQAEEIVIDETVSDEVDEFSLEEELALESDNGNGNGNGNGNSETTKEVVELPGENEVESIQSVDDLPEKVVNRVTETVHIVTDDETDIQD